MAAVQIDDLFLLPLIWYLSGEVTSSTPQVIQKACFFHLGDGVLHHHNYEPEGHPSLLVISRHLQGDVIQVHHDDPTVGHLGFAETYFRNRGNIFWHGMHCSIAKHVRSCHQCQTRKQPLALSYGEL